jgi:endonuclease/exonuclease/phosphatase family metal-dependent hydrolase
VPVTAYVHKYAPSYDLPYVFVSTANDGYNRNVILSRYPFGDLNGDGASQRADISYVNADLYAPGGNGGIRGFMFAEIDLPNALYSGDLVVGNAHLKAYGTQADHTERVTAARNVAYYIDYLLNGGGTSTPDPRGHISDSPPVTQVLAANTPVVLGGDWNEDEQRSVTNYGEKGPAGWLTQASSAGGTDGTDRDRSDATYDNSYVAKPSGSADRSTQGSSKLDYLVWQDSIATLRRSFIFNSGPLNTNPAWLPPELIGLVPATGASSVASDHRPVIADLILPSALQFDLSVNVTGPGSVTLDPPTGPYTYGTDVTLHATPDPGMYFIRWEGDVNGVANPTTVDMNTHKTVTAAFDVLPPPVYTLTLGAVGGGSAAGDPPGPYDYYDSVQVTATPAAGWVFDHWEGDLAGSLNPASVVMSTDQTVTAVFVPLYAVTATANGQGSVVLTPTGGIYPQGATVQLMALPAARWRFDHWEGGLAGTANPENLAVAGDTAITAVFGLIWQPGDMNCDGLLNNGDIDGFVMCVAVGRWNYEQAFPNCDYFNADCNGDGLVNNGDIDPFVMLLTGGR